jgi:hypothetical protein
MGISKKEELSAQAIQIFEILVSDFPATPGYRYDLAQAYLEFGTEASARNAVETMEKLVDEFPTVFDYRHVLGSAYNDMAVRSQGNARDWTQKAIDVADKLARDFPTRSELRQAQAIIRLNQGMLCWDESPTDSKASFREALEILKGAALEFPNQPGHMLMLSQMFNKIIQYLIAKRDWNEQIELTRDSIEFCNQHRSGRLFSASDPFILLKAHLRLANSHSLSSDEQAKHRADALTQLGRIASWIEETKPVSKRIESERVEAEELVELDAGIAAVSNTDLLLGEPSEAIRAAWFLHEYREEYVASARLFTQAMADPALTQELIAEHRLPAAYAALLAASGQGHGADAIDESERSFLRQAAIDWLRLDLKARREQVKDNASDSGAVAEYLSQWQQSPALASVRDVESLAKLTDEERERWKKLWGDVTELLKQCGRE